MAGRAFVPRYKQPFTLEEAVRMEIPTLTAGMLRHQGNRSLTIERRGFTIEISRLQGSIRLLNESQAQLQAEIDASANPDRDFVEAFEENKLTM
jgi:hypothetical protein